MKNRSVNLFQYNKRVKPRKKKARKNNLLDRDYTKDKPKTNEEILKTAVEDMCKGLNKFGPKEILNLMASHSHHDHVVQHLLARFPTIVAWGDFSSALPIRKVDKRTLRRLQKSGCIVEV